MIEANSGLLRVVSRQQMLETEQIQLAERKQAADPVISALAAHVSKRWSVARSSRSSIDARLLDCQRRKIGQYSETKLAEIKAAGMPSVYMRLTGIKCSTAAAWLSDVMQQPGERSWSIKPTPIHGQDEKLDGFLQQIVMQAAQAGKQLLPEEVDAIRKDAEKEIEAQLTKATEKMSLIIEDQLFEGNFDNALTDFIDDLCTFPAAFMKGAVMRTRETSHWVKQGEEWAEQTNIELAPEWERVSPFDMYPDPEAVNLDDSWLIERHRLSRSELRRFIGVDSYDTDAIKAVLMQFSDSGLQEMISTDTQRRKMESASSNNSNVQSSETIEAIELWDSIQGSKIISWDSGRGIIAQKINPLSEYKVNVWLIGTHVIRVMIAEDKQLSKIYYKASWERVAGSFWGTAMPEVMADIQDSCNAIARALLKNLSIAAGPQVVIHVDRLPPGTDIKEIYPLQIHQVTSAGSAGSPIEFFQPSSNAAELLGVFDKFEDKADMYTGIPRYTYGSSDVKGAGSTASGLSMLITAASKGIKRVVGHIDRELIKPLVTGIYHINMRHHPDLSAKLDANIQANGAKSLIVKEQAQQKRLEFLNATLNPIDSQIIGLGGRAKLLKESAKALDLPDDLVPSEAELQQKQEQMQQAQSQQQQ